MAKVEIKQPIVDEIAGYLADAQAMVLVDYRGLTVEEDTQLRKALREAGVDYKRAIKTVDLFSDSEAVALESKDRMEYLYPTSKDVEPNNNPVNKEVVE